MAKTKGTATKTKKEKEVVVSSSFAGKLSKAKDADRLTRAEDGMNVTFISLCQSQAKALDEDDNEFYIKGLQQKEFYVQAKKLRLGKSLKVVPLSFLTVYNEFSGSGQDAKMLGIWHKDDAVKFPLHPMHFFNRVMPNGNELRPVKWVLVYLPDHPDLDNAVVTFKSTANRVAKAWAKDVESHGGMSCQLIYELSAKRVENDKGKWFEITPEYVKHVFEDNDGDVTVNYDFAETVVDMSLEYNESYAKGTLIPRRSEAAMQIADSRPVVEDDDDEDEIPF